MNNNSVSFIRVSTNEILDFIASAKNRIIFAKRAFTRNEIEAILNVIKTNNISGTIYMEAGDSATRYGFGETEALELLRQNFERIEVHTTNRIKVGVLVVDESAIFYMPNLTFIEEESNEQAFPNGILCGSEVTNDIVRQFDFQQNTNEKIDRVGNVIALPGGHNPLLDRNKVKENLLESLKNLKNNPAIDPAKLNKVNFYRNKYKLVKMQICGVRINNKSISIKPFYSLLPEINERLKSSWNIFTLEDINELQDTKLFEIELAKIKDSYKEYLFDAGRFGSIIDVNKKAAFVESINKLKEDFKSYLGNDPSDEVRKRFESNISNKQLIVEKPALKTILQKSRTQLEEHLLKLCTKDDDFMGKVFSEYRHLKNKLNEDRHNLDEILKEFVALFVSNKLKFTEAKEIIDKIDIKCDWYDISDELLFDNKDFAKYIEEYNLDFRKNLIGYEKE